MIKRKTRATESNARTSIDGTPPNPTTYPPFKKASLYNQKISSKIKITLPIFFEDIKNPKLKKIKDEKLKRIFSLENIGSEADMQPQL